MLRLLLARDHSSVYFKRLYVFNVIVAFLLTLLVFVCKLSLKRKMTINASYDHSLEHFEDSKFSSDPVPFNAVVRSILVSRAKVGATIQDIRDDYYEYTGEKFPIENNIVDALLNIQGVVCSKNENGTFIFTLSHTNSKSQHVLDLVLKQKPNIRSMKKNIETPISSPGSSGSLCYFEDNYRFLDKYRASKRKKAHQSKPGAHLYDYQLLGDDFLLSTAKMELKCQFAPGYKVAQCGLCVSGQTIADATKRIRAATNLSQYIIVNIGSIDILHGHELIDLKYDFVELLNAFAEKNVEPIITTLAPLANNHHRPHLKLTLELFNEFLRINWPVVDLWTVFVNNRTGKTLYECYQTEARYVTGTNQPLVLWNNIGRQRILKCIKSQLL